MLLITTFVELRVLAGRSRTREGRPRTVSGRPMLIRTCHSMPMARCAVALRSRLQNGMARARHGMCESNTAALCKSDGKDTICTLSGTAWQGKGMDAALKRHGMCELALTSFLF
jgi:hypothetical protein